MRTCTKCGQTKPATDFFVRDKRTGRLHAQCKFCYKEHRKTYAAKHYKLYSEEYRKRAKKRRIKIRQELHAKIIIYLKNRHCEQCAENDIRVLDFDHIDPLQKSFSIARGITNGYKWEEILDEIQKCRILCANCHRKHTATQNGSYKSFILME